MTVITEPGVYTMGEAVARIPVGRTHFAIVDRADCRLVSPYRWHLLRGHNGKLYAHTVGSVYMHRLIAGTPPGYETDHRNGDGLDNTRRNLRTATPSQNRANMWKPKRADGLPQSSAYKGVTWDKPRGKWRAAIQVVGHSRNLGRYDLEDDAARAYDVAALAAWGEFARLNFPSVVVP
jgi:hypothetical protein